MTRSRAALVGALLGLSLASCNRGQAPSVEPEEPAAAPQAAADFDPGPSLDEIAAAIDPGPQALLSAELPPWFAEALRVPASGDPAAMLAEADAKLDEAKNRAKAGGDTAVLEALVELARGVVLAERAAAASGELSPEVALVLERVYDTVDAPALANDRNLFARMLQGFVTLIAEHGEAGDSAALNQIGQLVFQGLQKAGPARLHVVAELLRQAPDHAEIPDVLVRASKSVHRQDEALAIGMVRRSIALRKADAVTAEHWLDLSEACHGALKLRCGDDALARAQALGAGDDEALQGRMKTAESTAEHARRAVDLADAASLDDRLERAEHLVELTRHEEARAIYEQLLRLHPEDARPVVGFAGSLLNQYFDVVGALEVIERSSPREHLDETWYEMVIGVRATTMMYFMLPQLDMEDPDAAFEALRPMLVQLGRDIEGLNGLGAEKGRVLSFVYTLGMEAWLKTHATEQTAWVSFVRSLLPRVQKLRAEVPKSRHAYAFALATAEFSADREAALSVIDIEPPADDLAKRRAQAAFDLVATWDASERVTQLLRIVDAADGPDQPLATRQLAVDARVLAHRLGTAQDLAALERRYRELYETTAGSHDSQLINNLAVIVAEQGRQDEAQALWAMAIEYGGEDGNHVPRLNALAAKLAAGKPLNSGERKQLDDFVENGDYVDVRLQAQAWRVHTKAKKAERQLAADSAKEAEDNYRPRHMRHRGSVSLPGSMEINLGYSTRDGLVLNLDAVGIPWFLVPCPVAIPDARDK
ncbi:MAG: hypothetical protein AAF799_36935 [Myxococcota bacterium]